MNTTDPLFLASSIRQARLRLGWTQAELAARTGISAITCLRFESTGRIALGRFLRLAAAVGLEVTVGGASATAPTPDPRAERGRQRGIRRPRTVTAPAKAPVAAETPAPADTPAPAATPAAPAPERATTAPTSATPSVDAADIAAATKQYRDAIQNLVRTIVLNRVSNYTARSVVQNVMRAQHVADGDKPAFVGAVTGILNELNAENCAAYGFGAATLDAWAKTWRPDLGIVDAL